MILYKNIQSKRIYRIYYYSTPQLHYILNNMFYKYLIKHHLHTHNYSHSLAYLCNKNIKHVSHLKILLDLYYNYTTPFPINQKITHRVVEGFVTNVQSFKMPPFRFYMVSYYDVIYNWYKMLLLYLLSYFILVLIYLNLLCFHCHSCDDLNCILVNNE